MNPKLQDAVAVFKALGWENATPETVMRLPVGSAQQKQMALAGLRSGDLGEIAQIKEHTYGWRSFVDVDEQMLALFAVRVGVDARRAAALLRPVNPELIVEVLTARGAKYASAFIGHACVSSRRMYEHAASAFGNVAVRLVNRLHLDIPQSVEYLKDWSVYAAVALDLKAETRYRETNLPDLNMIRNRFEEHIRTGVAVGTPATGPFGAVLPAGVERGWLSRVIAVELVFSALDAAVRPGDRKVWLGVLDELSVSDQELAARTQALIPLLALGETAVIQRLAPVLIALAEEELLAEVVMAAFSATAKKARQLVLKSALDRPRPENAEILTAWLSLFATDSDRGTVSLATRLMERWHIRAEALPEEETGIQGLWRETPAVWQLPRFQLGEVSPEALTALAAEMLNQPSVVHDVTAERFLAMATAVAYRDTEAARASLRGLRRGWGLLDDVMWWVKGEEPRYGFDNDKRVYPPLTVRDAVVCRDLGKLPCLLSTPSMVDLSVCVEDLAGRLSMYQTTGTDVREADLFLALTRLDTGTKTAETVELLRSLCVPVVLHSGEKMPVSAGQIVLAYLDDPVQEPAVETSGYGFWGQGEISVPQSLSSFPNRLAGYQHELFAVFPRWGDAAFSEVRWDGGEVYHHQGLILRQVVRRAIPLPPGASINLLAAQRSLSPHAAADSMQAVTEAWERGLLRPGIFDVALLDWSASPPSNLAALAAALDSVARDSKLSVVWPILDALIETSLKAPRLLAGTAELAGLILEFLPEVQFVVEQGMAGNAALHLPGIRALAGRGGSSQAVTAARNAVAQLPPISEPVEKPHSVPLEMQPPFEDIWPACRPGPTPIDDGVTVTVDWAYPSDKTKRFLFTLIVPGIPNRIFQVVNRGWYYDLEQEGQCVAYAAEPGTMSFAGNQESSRVWLHWDEVQRAMMVCEHRNWAAGKDGPLEGVQPPPLPASLLTVAVGLLAQDGDALYYAPRLLRKLIKRDEIGEDMIRRATRTLLQSPVVSPAKLVRALEKDTELLPILWPMLTESVKAAGTLVAAGNKPPVWVNRILDVALWYAPYLAEAARRGQIPPRDAQWPGLTEIAASAAKSVAVSKAKALVTQLAVQGDPGLE